MKDNKSFSEEQGADKIRGVRSEACVYAEKLKNESDGAFIK